MCTGMEAEEKYCWMLDTKEFEDDDAFSRGGIEVVGRKGCTFRPFAFCSSKTDYLVRNILGILIIRSFPNLHSF